jgi:serine/threonine protein kinase
MSSSQSSVSVTKRGPDNYQSIKYLGKGTFGNVVLAEDKETGKQYAMKIIEKKKIKEFNVLQSEVIRKISQCDLFVRIK